MNDPAKGRVLGMIERPDHDQMYLAQRLSDTWGKTLTIPALQRLNTMFGRVAVTNKLRELHGFPPVEVRDLYSYLVGMLKAVSA